MIEKVHGLQATSMSLNDRFSMLASAAPDRNIRQRQPQSQRRRPNNGSVYNQTLNARNRQLIEQIARSLEWQRKRQELRQRIGQASGQFRRFGSENSLPGLRRSNSYGSLHQNYQNNVKNRLSWRQSNGNLSRSASFGNVSHAAWRGRALRGLRRRGGGQRATRGRFWGGRGGRAIAGRVTRVAGRGRRRGGGRAYSYQQAGGAGGRGRGRGQGRGRGRGNGILRSQTPKPVPTKEELDEQLDQYMASSKSALDKELEEYMKSAMEMDQ